MGQRQKVSKWCLMAIARCSVATVLQFLKNSVSTKHSKAKHNRMRYACTFLLDFGSLRHVPVFLFDAVIIRENVDAYGSGSIS